MLQHLTKSPCATAPLAITPTTRCIFFSPSYIPPIASIANTISRNRSQGAELSAKQQAAIIYAIEYKTTSQTKLALQFGCYRNIIANTFKRYQERKDLKSRPRTGRPKKFSNRSR